MRLQCEAVKRLAKRLENVTILKKGKIDIISDGQEVVCNQTEGSLKRCGGIGYFLTGTLGLFFLVWFCEWKVVSYQKPKYNCSLFGFGFY